jgi:hypothetical protein
MTLDDAVREAIEHRAREGRTELAFGGPENVVERAITGSRQRARRRIAVASAAAVVVALLGTGAVMKSGLLGANATPIVAAAPATKIVPGKIAVAAYGSLVGGKQRWKLCNPRTGKYGDVPGSVVAVSPDGRYAVLRSDPELKDGFSVPPVYTVWDSGSQEAVRDLHFPIDTGRPFWSPDGRWLAFPHARHQNLEDGVTSGVSFLDVVTGRTSKVELGSLPYEAEAPRGWAHDSSAVIFDTAGDRDAAFVGVKPTGELRGIRGGFPPMDGTVGEGTAIGGGPAAILWASGNPPHVYSADVETGKIRDSYDAKPRTVIAVNSQWVTARTVVWSAGADIRLLDVSSGAQKIALTLPSKADSTLFTELPAGALTPAFDVR